MKKAERLIAKACLDEIDCTVKIVKKPLTRKTYLAARRWYKFQREKLKEIKYNKKVLRFPKHRLKKEVVEDDKERYD